MADSSGMSELPKMLPCLLKGPGPTASHDSSHDTCALVKRPGSRSCGQLRCLSWLHLGQQALWLCCCARSWQPGNYKAAWTGDAHGHLQSCAAVFTKQRTPTLGTTAIAAMRWGHISHFALLHARLIAFIANSSALCLEQERTPQ